MTKYCLVSDDSGHDYVIPSENRKEWYEFLDLPEDDPNSDPVPDWARRVEGGLEFENPTENGKLLFHEQYHNVDEFYRIEPTLSIDINQFGDSTSMNLIMDKLFTFETINERLDFLDRSNIQYKIVSA